MKGGIKFKDYLKSGLSDKKMIEVRDEYFISPNEIKMN